MNVLIFVMTMLMLLSLMTYSRLDSYINSQAYQIIFKKYMEKNERGYINSQAKGVYDNIHVTEKDESEENKDKEDKAKKKKVDANKKINLSLLFDPKRGDKEKEWEQTKILLKNLMKNLYSKQPFYLKMENEQPGFVDTLLNAIVKAIDELPKEKKPREAQDLGNLKLSDPKLDSVLYKMLNGAISIEEQAKNNLKTQAKSQEDAGETSSDDNKEEVSDEYKSPEGYYSMLDYVTSKGPKPIRVFLAPKNVLLTIFPENTVDNIIAERDLLYKQATGGADVDQLTDTFKNQFLNARDSAINEEMLNFQVSKTKPGQ